MLDHTTGTSATQVKIPGTDDTARDAPARRRAEMDIRTLRPYLAITFGLTWGIGVLLVLFGDQIEAVFGELGPTNPVYLLAVYSPAVAAVILVLRHHGADGLRRYLRRLTLWRMPRAWWAFLLVGIPALVYASAAIAGTVTDFPFSPWYGVLPAAALAMVFGPVEELGWRGLGLPLLQQRFTPLQAGLIIGFFWALWHTPAFLLSGTVQSSWSFVPFFLGVVAISVIITPAFNAARGSILLAGLFHFQLMNPVFPEADPWDKLVFIAVAGAVVIINRRQMLTRAGAVTDVLLPTAGTPDSTDAG